MVTDSSHCLTSHSSRQLIDTDNMPWHLCRHQHGLDSQERDFIAANEAVLGDFMDRIDRVADEVDKHRMGPSGDTDCADTLRTAVQELRQVQN